MKKVNYLIILVCLAYFLCVSAILANGQTSVKQDASGNYIAVTASGQKSGSKAVLTGKYFTDSKGVKYPVYKSVNGKLFYVRTSKAGKKYNAYLTVKQ